MPIAMFPAPAAVMALYVFSFIMYSLSHSILGIVTVNCRFHFVINIYFSFIRLIIQIFHYIATMAYSKLYGKEIRYCSNRKEAKDHGDTGILLGSKLRDGETSVPGSLP